jgi:RHS repeat-associated protein
VEGSTLVWLKSAQSPESCGNLAEGLPQPSAYYQDQLGSTRGILDSRGSTLATYTYDPYGTLKSSTGTVSNPFQYAGQYTDSESGLQYLRARYYDPGTAQFLTVDPMADSTGEPYGYSIDDPVNRTDASGLITVGVCVGVSVGLKLHAGLQGCVQLGLPNHNSLPEVGVTGTVAVGGGTPSASLYVQPEASNAVHINDLSGPFLYGGGSAGEVLGIGGSIFVGHDNCGRRIIGGGPTLGFGGVMPVPAEGHAGISNTWTVSTGGTSNSCSCPTS